MDKVETLDLGQGFVLECSVPAFGQVQARLTFRGHELVHEVFGPGPQVFPLRIPSNPLIEADGALEIDMFNGEILWTLHFQVYDPLSRTPGHLKTVINDNGEVLRLFDPTIGAVGHSSTFGVPSVVDSGTFGPSQLCAPVILRLHVGDEERCISNVGMIVKKMMFPDCPPFTYNVVACTGAAAADQPGAYSDPRSPWFNVFFGFYQVDCDKKQWDRPFGYETAAGVDSETRVEDVVRLGKADWNWFSNWMYGVPEQELAPYDTVDMSTVTTNVCQVTVGTTIWHEVTLSGVEVASCYKSDAPGAERLVENTIMSDVWRRSFGLPNPRPELTQSFIPTVMDATFDMAYWEDDEMYHTVMFGGTARQGTAPEFLQAQIDAVQAVMRDSYADLGFGA